MVFTIHRYIFFDLVKTFCQATVILSVILGLGIMLPLLRQFSVDPIQEGAGDLTGLELAWLPEEYEPDAKTGHDTQDVGDTCEEHKPDTKPVYGTQDVANMCHGHEYSQQPVYMQELSRKDARAPGMNGTRL